jgi:hypothetical protein
MMPRTVSSTSLAAQSACHAPGNQAFDLVKVGTAAIHCLVHGAKVPAHNAAMLTRYGVHMTSK